MKISKIICLSLLFKLLKSHITLYYYIMLYYIIFLTKSKADLKKFWVCGIAHSWTTVISFIDLRQRKTTNLCKDLADDNDLSIQWIAWKACDLKTCHLSTSDRAFMNTNSNIHPHTLRCSCKLKVGAVSCVAGWSTSPHMKDVNSRGSEACDHHSGGFGPGWRVAQLLLLLDGREQIMSKC